MAPSRRGLNRSSGYAVWFLSHGHGPGMGHSHPAALLRWPGRCGDESTILRENGPLSNGGDQISLIGLRAGAGPRIVPEATGDGMRVGAKVSADVGNGSDRSNSQ